VWFILNEITAVRDDRTTSETSQDMRFLGRNWKPGPPENKAAVHSTFGRVPCTVYRVPCTYRIICYNVNMLHNVISQFDIKYNKMIFKFVHTCFGQWKYKDTQTLRCCVCVCICVCMYVCVCMCVCMYIYIYIYIYMGTAITQSA